MVFLAHPMLPAHGKGGYTWYLIVGEGQEDGTLALSLPAATAARLAGKTFVTMILE